MKNLQNLFPEIKIDEDKNFSRQKEAAAIYADERGRKKCLAIIKIILDRRPDLKSEVYIHFTKTQIP